MGARNNNFENIVRGYVQGGEHSIRIEVVGEGDERPKKEGRADNKGSGGTNGENERCNGTTQRSGSSVRPITSATLGNPWNAMRV
jgi:hypothetical protein